MVVARRKITFDRNLVPDLQKAVPGSGCHGEPISGNSQTTNAVIMARQNTYTVPQDGYEVSMTGQLAHPSNLNKHNLTHSPLLHTSI